LAVDTLDLAGLVPGLMARHRECVWTLLSGRVPDEDLVVELHPIAWPQRVAVVRVDAGAEVFSFSFAGHESTDFAYLDSDRPETLQERIDLAVAAATGPTRVICDTAGGIVVGSTLIFDHGGPHPRTDTVVSYPSRRLKARLRGHRIKREVTDFPRA
jgi:hypothetical protein